MDGKEAASMIEVSALAADAFALAYEIDCFVEKTNQVTRIRCSAAIDKLNMAKMALVYIGGESSYNRFKKSAMRARENRADPGSR